jgi:hypothetical protein
MISIVGDFFFWQEAISFLTRLACGFYVRLCLT